MNARSQGSPRAILFDWDNTLVDTWPTIVECYRDTFTALGHTPWTAQEVKERAHGSLRDAFPALFGPRAGEAEKVFYETFFRIHLERLTPLPGAEELLKHRFAIINLWRPIRGPVLESPLTLCDAQSLAEEDLVASDLRYPDRVGETYSITYNPNQRYYYFPKMQTDEAVLIRCFDSALAGPQRFSAHTGFDDPESPADAPPRESIEVRTLVFFPPGA